MSWKKVGQLTDVLEKSWTAYRCLGKKLEKVSSNVADKIMNEAATQIHKKNIFDEIVHCALSVDGTWHRREKLFYCWKILLKNWNKLIQLFKIMSPALKNGDSQMVIKADKVPLGEHVGIFNAATVSEVAFTIVSDTVDNRAINITRQDSTVSTISDLHCSYDALQYP
ncbi:helitron_like_N domain-containing protein [Nephila pilipes]|uniref:Helitron_like_N domain-containing protein n=1 Tax=Nephila pilipes TaxID=299642 RepID=A0A8X6R2G5_NEPPI|nr:helitron_like_N domain-containing protein [Nephila pilipes]